MTYIVLFLAISAPLLYPRPAAADVFTLAAVDAGKYRANRSADTDLADPGSHDPDRYEFGIGLHGDFVGTEDRAFLVFDLSGITGTVHSAALRLTSSFLFYEVEHLEPPEPILLTLFDVETDIADLRAGGTDKNSTFADLGSGTVLGSLDYPYDSIPATHSIAFNNAGVEIVRQALGDQVAFGAAATEYRDRRIRLLGFEPEYELVIDVPEPSTTILAGIALAGLLGCAHTRRRRAAR